jgi:hypothetical protein
VASLARRKQNVALVRVLYLPNPRSSLALVHESGLGPELPIPSVHFPIANGGKADIGQRMPNKAIYEYTSSSRQLVGELGKHFRSFRHLRVRFVRRWPRSPSVQLQDPVLHRPRPENG